MTSRPKLFRNVLLASLAVGTAGIVAAQSQTEIHLAAATRNVGNDAFMLKYARAFYCNLPEDNNQIVIASRGWNNTTGTGDNAQHRVPLTQIFDDIWFIGNHYVGQYLIKTDTGLVQVDAGNRASEIELFNYPAMQTLGLSPTYPLKGVFITHGHGDHDGGASWLKTNLGAEMFLGSADANNKAYAPTTIDSTNLQMREMSIGGKKFWVLPTPGHTPGSTSAVLEATDQGKKVRVLINGGQSMSSSSVSAVADYLDSIERTYWMAKTLNVEGVMTPHVYWDGTNTLLDEINASGRSKPSQFVFGHETVLRQLAVARECSAAWLTKLDATVVLPTWRTTSLAFEGEQSSDRLVAKLQSGSEPLAGQQVVFTVVDKNASCAASTNNDGIARCEIPNFLASSDKVTAEFKGTSNPTVVELPSSTQTALADATDGGGCTLGHGGNGRFDPMLAGLALLAGIGVWRRRKPRHG